MGKSRGWDVAGLTVDLSGVDLSRGAREGLVRRAQAEGGAAREQLLLTCYPFLVSRARRFFGKGLDLDDLCQEGVLALDRALGKFDPGLGYTFLTYAGHWVDQFMGRALADRGCRGLRLPEPVTRVRWLRRRVRGSLWQYLEAMPSEAEVTLALEAAVGVETPPSYNEARVEQAGRPHESLRWPRADDDDATEKDPEDPRSLSEELEGRSEVARLYLALGRLPERERRCLVLRYGLLGGREHTLREVGLLRLLGRELSHQRVRQIEAAGLRHLRLLLGAEQGEEDTGE